MKVIILLLLLCNIPVLIGISNGLMIKELEDFEKARQNYSVVILNETTTIPIVDYAYLNGTYVGPQLNPITIAHSAFRDYATIQKSNYNNETALINLIIKADWFLGNAKDHGNYSLLEYNFNFPAYQMKPPWYSSMAQAQAIQVLIQAHNMTKDERYMDLSENLLNAFYIDVKNGGVTYKDDHGWWYEEYASPRNLQEPRVLNGMGYTLIGLYDYYNYTNSPKAKYLLEKGLESFIENFEKYDNNVLSAYDLLGRPADKFYHEVHLEILDKLYRITGNNFFIEQYNKWEPRI